MNDKERWQDFINNLEKIDQIGSQFLLQKYNPSQEYDWEADIEDIEYVAGLVRQNGLPMDEDLVRMLACTITEMKKSESKMPQLLWQYIIVIMFNTYNKMPPQNRFGIMKTAFIFGVYLERLYDWELDDT